MMQIKSHMTIFLTYLTNDNKLIVLIQKKPSQSD